MRDAFLKHYNPYSYLPLLFYLTVRLILKVLYAMFFLYCVFQSLSFVCHRSMTKVVGSSISRAVSSLTTAASCYISSSHCLTTRAPARPAAVVATAQAAVAAASSQSLMWWQSVLRTPLHLNTHQTVLGTHLLRSIQTLQTVLVTLLRRSTRVQTVLGTSLPRSTPPCQTVLVTSRHRSILPHLCTLLHRWPPIPWRPRRGASFLVTTG